jgi:hypothetical protein
MQPGRLDASFGSPYAIQSPAYPPTTMPPNGRYPVNSAGGGVAPLQQQQHPAVATTAAAINYQQHPVPHAPPAAYQMYSRNRDDVYAWEEDMEWKERQRKKLKQEMKNKLSMNKIKEKLCKLEKMSNKKGRRYDNAALTAQHPAVIQATVAPTGIQPQTILWTGAFCILVVILVLCVVVLIKMEASQSQLYNMHLAKLSGLSNNNMLTSQQF